MLIDGVYKWYHNSVNVQVVQCHQRSQHACEHSSLPIYILWHGMLPLAHPSPIIPLLCIGLTLISVYRCSLHTRHDNPDVRAAAQQIQDYVSSVLHSPLLAFIISSHLVFNNIDH
jgi:hypothetical protein